MEWRGADSAMGDGRDRESGTGGRQKYAGPRGAPKLAHSLEGDSSLARGRADDNRGVRRGFHGGSDADTLGLGAWTGAPRR